MILSRTLKVKAHFKGTIARRRVRGDENSVHEVSPSALSEAASGQASRLGQIEPTPRPDYQAHHGINESAFPYHEVGRQSAEQRPGDNVRGVMDAAVDAGQAKQRGQHEEQSPQPAVVQPNGSGYGETNSGGVAGEG